MAVNKVIYGGKTLVDLSSDTVTAKDVRKGAIFHAPSGETATGTLGTATQSEDGMMSAADKKKLDGIAAGAQAVPKHTYNASDHSLTFGV